MSLPELALWPLAPGAALHDLVARYAEPHRHYHNLAHVLDVLHALHPCGLALSLAAWYHDAVYDPRRADNEERSAELLASADVAPADVVGEAARLILLTKSHTANDADADGLALLDADLAILGAEPAAYDAYATAIRREYGWVPEADYRQGRAEVLRRFLGRQRIFRTGRMCGREAAARANLTRELERLDGVGRGA